MTSAARRLERTWYEGASGSLPLLPLSWLFAAGVRARRALYAGGVLRTRGVGVPVIVVGNITVGGTGKTPLVAWLAGRLQVAGFRPGIASRGYGGGRRLEPVRVDPGSAAADVGDEPVLLARRTQVPVFVCTRRVLAADRLVEAGVDVVISDDGLQHYALARDLEIIVIDGDRRLGNGRLLPAGPLREPPARLRGGPLVMVNGGTAVPPELGFEVHGTVAVALNRRERRPLSLFRGEKVWAVAGIGNPARFHTELARHGIESVAVPVPDHGRVDLRALRDEADWPILMTEKDAVKYTGLRDVAAWYVPADVVMPAESEMAVMARVRAILPDRPAAAAGS